jgi:hypothetical protein
MALNSTSFSMSSCPNGLVLPDDPDSSGNWYPNRALSNCSVSCSSPPYFTTEQRSTLETLDIVSMAVAAVFAAFVFKMWRRDNLKRKQYFVTSYGFIVALCFSLLSIMFPFEVRCRNNANVIDGSDGFTLCAAEGAVLLFMENFCAMCFCLQSYEVFRRFVLQQRSAANVELYLNLILGWPLLVALIALFAGLIGSTFGGDFCRITGTSAFSIVFGYGTVFVGTVCGLVFSTAIVVKLMGLVAIRSISRHDGLSLAGTSIKYLVFTGCYLLSLILISLFSPLLDDDAFRDSIDDWAQCALLHFNGTDASYLPFCGAHARRKMSFAAYAFTTVYFRAGFGLFFVIVNMEGLLILLRKHVCMMTVTPVSAATPTPPTIDSLLTNPPVERKRKSDENEKHIKSHLGADEAHMAFARDRVDDRPDVNPPDFLLSGNAVPAASPVRMAVYHRIEGCCEETQDAEEEGQILTLPGFMAPRVELTQL